MARALASSTRRCRVELSRLGLPALRPRVSQPEIFGHAHERRLTALRAASGAFIILTTLNAATQFVPPRAALRDSAFGATVGKRLDEAGVAGFWCGWFFQTPTVTDYGLTPAGAASRRLAAGRGGGRCGSTFSADIARRYAPLSTRLAAHDGKACSGWKLAPVSECAGRGGDHLVPAELPHRIRRVGPGRSPLRGGPAPAESTQGV